MQKRFYIYEFPENLIDLANYLETGQSMPMLGSRTGLNVKEGARALKIKLVKYMNKIPTNLQGQKRKLDCITSGSRLFENCAKKLATWKDTAENKPVPISSRLEQRKYFSFMSTVGGLSIGDITLINPDNGNDNRVRAPVQRYKVTRS